MNKPVHIRITGCLALAIIAGCILSWLIFAIIFIFICRP